ncbi:MAG: hypothetical protein PHY71_04320 [Bacteroidaceae bacterium]|nr:hypothetical protein [Bacteroidaceae bacterium]
MKEERSKKRWRKDSGNRGVQSGTRRLGDVVLTYSLFLALSIGLVSCSPKSTHQDYVTDVYQTSYAGDNLKLMANDAVKKGTYCGEESSVTAFP